MNNVSKSEEEMFLAEPLLTWKPKPKEKIFFAFIYTAFGVMYAYPWNSLINVLQILSLELYDDDGLADNLLVVNEILALSIVIYFLFSTGVRPILFRVSILVYGLCLLGLTLVFLFFPRDSVFVKPLLYILIIPFGACLATVASIAYVFGSMMPETYTGFVSLGSGLAGFLAFIMFFLADKVFWIRGSDNAKEQIIKSTCFIFAFPFILSIILFIAISFLYKTPIFKDQMKKFYFRENPDKKFENFKSINKDDAIYNDNTSEVPIEMRESRGIKAIWRDSAQQLITVLVTSWLGLFLFPIIGPYMWKRSYINDLQIGIYQFGDFIGRYIANKQNFARLPREHLIYYCFARLLFILLFSLPVFFDSFNFYPFLICIMLSYAISNGYVASLSIIYAPDSVERVKEKSFIGTFIAVGTQVMFTLGMSSAKGYKLLLEAIRNNL